MQRNCLVIAAALIPAFVALNCTADARGGGAKEHSFAPEHVGNLPADIQLRLAARERACGGKAAAGHYFSTTLVAGGLHFRSLHFEEFSCANRGAICRVGGCLHEVYLESGGRSHLVFSAYVQDLKMTNPGGIAILEVYGTSGQQMLRWNGRSFVPVRSLAKGQ